MTMMDALPIKCCMLNFFFFSNRCILNLATTLIVMVISGSIIVHWFEIYTALQKQKQKIIPNGCTCCCKL